MASPSVCFMLIVGSIASFLIFADFLKPLSLCEKLQLNLSSPTALITSHHTPLNRSFQSIHYNLRSVTLTP